MTAEEVYQSLREAFGEQKIVGAKLEACDPWIEVAPAAIVEVCRHLRDAEPFRFETLNDLCAVDYLETDPKAKNPRDPHLEVVYQLYSYAHRHRLTLKVKLPRWNEAPGKLPELDSVSSVWDIADWHEREVYDLMGISFTDHPDLRRILCPEDWVGHPLRKDYEFPLEYHGIRGK